MIAKKQLSSSHVTILHRSIGSLSEKMLVVQAALVMALEGKTRATATEITDRALADYEGYVQPSVVGQLASLLHIRRVTSHGRSRLVLDKTQLETLQADLAARVEAMGPEIEKALASFKALAVRVTDLEVRVSRVKDMARREPEMKKYLRDRQRVIMHLSIIERSYQDLKAKVDRMGQFEKACAELQETVKDLPSLEGRWTELREKTDGHQAEKDRIAREEERLSAAEKRLDDREQTLKERNRRYRVRHGLVELGEITTEIGERRKELDDVRKQLGEKNARLSRMLGRDQAGES